MNDILLERPRVDSTGVTEIGRNSLGLVGRGTFRIGVMAVVFHCCGTVPSITWTLRVADVKTLETFYLKCLRHFLGVRWHQRITESEILSHVGIGPLAEHITTWPHRTTG